MRSESERDERRRRVAALLVSLAVHAGLVAFLQRSHPGHPFPETTPPIPVALYREPAPVAAPAEETPAPPAVEPPPPPVAKAPPPPVAPALPEPERVPAPPPLALEPEPTIDPEPLPPAAPPPTPVAADVDEGASSPAAPAAPVIAVAPTTVPTRDFTRVFGEAEVDRTASARRPIRADYPERERRRGRESSVVVQLTIGADGRVDGIDILESGGSAFDQAALRALRGARFAPAVVAGRAVASELRYRLRFALR